MTDKELISFRDELVIKKHFSSDELTKQILEWCIKEANKEIQKREIKEDE